MRSSPLRLAPGDAKQFSIADVLVRFRSKLDGTVLLLPWSFASFEVLEGAPHVEVTVRARPDFEPIEGDIVSSSSSHWRLARGESRLVFELFHPPTGEAYCRMSVDDAFSRADIVFAETSWLGIGADRREWLLPHPLDQLLLAPALALRGACLLHACGASIDGRAAVFAGHSGDGKTTLAGLLEGEGVELLSDERVALRPEKNRVLAYGTPWPGEGEIASRERRPLSRLFVLRKAPRHGIGSPSRGLSAELVARTILPFYLPEVATTILGLLERVVSKVPVRELQFARCPGLRNLLSGVSLA